MPIALTFQGPLTVTYESGRPLPLTLSGELRGGLGDATGELALVSVATASDPQLPANLRDAVFEYAADAGPQTCIVRAGGRDFAIEARQVFVHRDLRAPMRRAVPPQPVSAGYRWRWRLGIFVARIPGLRTWLS